MGRPHPSMLAFTAAGSSPPIAFCPAPPGPERAEGPQRDLHFRHSAAARTYLGHKVDTITDHPGPPAELRHACAMLSPPTDSHMRLTRTAVGSVTVVAPYPLRSGQHCGA